MMREYEEKAAHAKTEKKHECQQPRVAKLFRDSDFTVSGRQSANRQKKDGRDDDDDWRLAPSREIERRDGRRFCLGSHTISIPLSNPRELHRSVREIGRAHV